MEMVSAKSSLGHAEAGAGALGIMRGIVRQQTRCAAPLTHLRMLNPHVLSILDSSSAKCLVSLPRQPAPGAANGSPYLGISSFAFQVGVTEQTL